MDDEGNAFFDTTDNDGTCKICGNVNVELTPVRDKQGIKHLACEVCAEKLRKERMGASLSFLGHFTDENRTVLYGLGVTKSDNPVMVISKLLKEIKRLREIIKQREINHKEEAVIGGTTGGDNG